MAKSNNREPEGANPDDFDILLEHGFGKTDSIPAAMLFSARSEGPAIALAEPARSAAVLPPDLASEDAPAGGNLAGRYQIFGEFARGGVGALFRARDHVLRRDVAIKVLLSRHKNRPELHRRFLEEAQICAQLQHPGIVPLHDAGLTEDGRPFLAMKLIQGETLSARLASRKDSSEQRHDLVRVLAQICQAIAYAHARGVIHRDLKPGNVMVGAFGEVQVMDFGMAKVLAREAAPRAEEPVGIQAPPITTIRSDDPSSASVGGSVMGTYAYMSPEQAQGDVERLDARSDVFGLGAILCEILTGAAPYRGEREALRLKAAAGDLSDADARLHGCGAEAELVALCRSCIAPMQTDRPKDARALAEQLETYLASLQERARAAQMTAVRAEDRVLAESKRRRLHVALMFMLLVLIGAGAGGWNYLRSEHSARVLRTAEAVDRTIAASRGTRPEVTLESPESAAQWAEALAGARQAVEFSRGPDADEATRMRAALFLTEMEETERRMQLQREQSARAARMQARLIDIHGQLMSTWRWEAHDHKYAAAYKEYGLDVEIQSEAALAAAIGSSGIAADLIVGMDQWAQCKSMSRPTDTAGRERLRRILQIADPDPLRLQIREAAKNKDRQLALQLARDVDRAKVPPISAAQLAWTLWSAGEAKEAVQLSRDVALQHPGDFGINFQAGMLLSFSGQGRAADAVRYYSAALASRPDSLVAANNLGAELVKNGERDEAIQVLKRIISIHPDAAILPANLGGILEGSGRLAEALESYRTAFSLEPQDPRIHEHVARALKRMGQLEEAQTAYAEALELYPDDASLWLSYGAMLCDQLDDANGAVHAFEKVVEISPEDLKGWRNLVIARVKIGDSEGALLALGKLAELEPPSVWKHEVTGERNLQLERF